MTFYTPRKHQGTFGFLIFSRGIERNQFFSIRVFLHRHWLFTREQERRRDHLLFQFIISTCSRTFRHSFEVLYMRWLSCNFNRIVCVYQAVTRWNIPPYWITIWLIDDAILVFVCLLDDLILNFCYSNLTHKTGGFELALTITFEFQAKPTNQLL